MCPKSGKKGRYTILQLQALDAQVRLHLRPQHVKTLMKTAVNNTACTVCVLKYSNYSWSQRNYFFHVASLEICIVIPEYGE